MSPALGSDSEARSLNKLLPAVPAWIYANLERWHYLSFLRTNNVREILRSARIRALEPEKIQALIAIVDEDLGYQLHQAVQELKFALSRAEDAEFRFRGAGMDLRIPVTRAKFETWISEELERLKVLSMPCCRVRGSRRARWIACFLRADLLLCPRCGGFLRAGLERIAFAGGMNSLRWRMGWRCVRLNRFAGVRASTPKGCVDVDQTVIKG